MARLNFRDGQSINFQKPSRIRTRGWRVGAVCTPQHTYSTDQNPIKVYEN